MKRACLRLEYLLAALFAYGGVQGAIANIYQWEYIDPMDPSQGKQQSSVLTPGGAGLHAVPGANLFNRNLTMAYLIGADLTAADMRWARLENAALNNATLRSASFDSAFLNGADFANADVRGTNFEFTVGRGFTAAQLYSTASYQAGDLTGVSLALNDLSGWNFAGQNLTRAGFYNAALSGVDFTDATIRGVDFRRASGFTAAQLYSTASYQAGDLQDINFNQRNVSSWNFANQNIMGADFWDSNLTNTDFSGANVRNVRFDGTNFVSAQLYSTASYQQGDLVGVGLSAMNVSGWNFVETDLTRASFVNSALDGTDFTSAIIRGALFSGDTSPKPLTATQLYSTASYQTRDLAGTFFVSIDLSGWDFSGQNLTNASFDYADLTDTDFTGANIVGVWFSHHNTRGTGHLAEAQLYTTASYQARELMRLRLISHNLSGWDFAGQDLNGASLGASTLSNTNFSEATLVGATISNIMATNTDFGGANLSITFFNGSLTSVDFSHAKLTGASFLATVIDSNFTGADVRGASGMATHLNHPNTITTNTIRPNGEINGLDLTANHSLTVRDYDGAIRATAFGQGFGEPIPILIRQHVMMDQDSLLKVVLGENEWNSLISFEPEIPVALDGTLQLDFTPGVDVVSQAGRTIQIFNWSGVAPIGQFTVSSLHEWDVSQLYITGEVTLIDEVFLPGDINRDGTVDAADYVFWRKDNGTPQEYDEWRSNFGQSIGNASALAAPPSAAVPEPTGLLIAFSGCVAIFRISRCRFRRCARVS